MTVFILICWINWRLLSRWFRNTISRNLQYGYWLVTIVCCLAISYSWPIRPIAPFVNPGGISAVYPAVIWLLGQVILLLLFPLLFGIRWLIHHIDKTTAIAGTEHMMTRRIFLQKTLGIAPILAFGFSAQGVYAAEEVMEVRHLELSVPGLPNDLKGFKIAQISDTHLGPYFSLNKLDEVIALVRREKPDLVAITGDLIDDLDVLTPCIKKLSALARVIPHGVYFCWGNHEYFRNINLIRTELQKSPVKVLANSNSSIIVGETPLYLLGVDYPQTNNFLEREKLRRQFMSKAQARIPVGAFRVLIAHHPDFLFDGFCR